MTAVRIVAAVPSDLEGFLNLLEDLAVWLEARGISQWRSGSFRRSEAYYAQSIRQEEVFLARHGDELVGAFRLLLHEPIVWPDIATDDGVYVYNLAVKRAWAAHGLGRQMLSWADERAIALGRRYVRLDCVASNQFLRGYYLRAGFDDRGEIDARFPEPVGTLRLQRYEKRLLAGARRAGGE